MGNLGIAHVAWPTINNPILALPISTCVSEIRNLYRFRLYETIGSGHYLYLHMSVIDPKTTYNAMQCKSHGIIEWAGVGFYLTIKTIS